MTYLKSILKEIERQVNKPIRVVLPSFIDEAKVDLERGIIAIPIEKGTEVILLPSQAKEGELREFREKALREMVVDYRLVKRTIELVWGMLKGEKELNETQEWEEELEIEKETEDVEKKRKIAPKKSEKVELSKSKSEEKEKVHKREVKEDDFDEDLDDFDDDLF